MRRPLTLLSGALAGFGLYRLVSSRRRRPAYAPVAPPPEPSVDPRAEELRRKLAEARTIVEERDEFEAAETPVDRAEAPEVDERRKRVHEEGRRTAQRMRRRTDDT